jgi:glycosyltransferase involved in cell wall biosynthesis
MTRTRVRYWCFNYAPKWEAVSKEIDILMTGLADTVDGSLVTLDTRDSRVRLRGPIQCIPLPHGLPLLPLVLAHAFRGGVNHLFASAGERWLTPILARRRGVLTIAKSTSDATRIGRNAPVLRSFGAIVTQSERDRDLMQQLGVRTDAIHLIRPGVPVAEYREAQGPFTILFASSPFYAEEFRSRGIELLARTAPRLPDVRFLLVWRRHHLGKLRRLLLDAGATNVDIHDGVVTDMGEMYDRVHATILPGTEPHSFIPAPRSGLESLAHGKPLLASHHVALADSLAPAGAGVVFDPTVAGLEAAVRRLRREYAAIQPRAQPYIRERYCPARHLALYRLLYQAVGR